MVIYSNRQYLGEWEFVFVGHQLVCSNCKLIPGLCKCDIVENVQETEHGQRVRGSSSDLIAIVRTLIF